MKTLPALRSLFPLLLLSLPVSAAPPPPTAQQVGQAIAERRSRVEELRLIKQAAEELGMRVWLFGGTAAGFAHYVRSDLAREAGDARYRESFFDYDFTNIYRSTQDADLVVDATPEQAAQLEGLIKQKLSFLQGSKEHWEVRLLRQDRTVGSQVKQALLHNPDFLGQHTDSNSTGMIELTDPPQGEAVVRDLRDWESPLPFFLKDVTEGRLHYYWSPTHRETSRYRSGDNPEIFSVIRYLVKAFQYDLQVEGEDLQKVQGIIAAFDPQRDYPRLSSWARGWLERYGPNLLRHSVNVEYAWNTLEALGLRRKLISLSDPSRVDTLGWWLSREPLRTAPVGTGTGRTAAELGIEVVAHETKDFLAYESITRDMTLRPNVLISRPNHPGESAVLGPGFYTQQGRKGAAGTGLTIRFKVDPRAREGTDFTVYQDGRVLVTNRAALQVIPESLNFTWLEYFQMLAGGLGVDESDRGVLMKLQRRLALKPMAPEEEAGVVAVVGEAIDKVWTSDRLPLVVWEWLASPLSLQQPELEDRLVAAISAEIRRARGTAQPTQPLPFGDRFPLLWQWFQGPGFKGAFPLARRHPELFGELVANLEVGTPRGYVDDALMAAKLLQDPAWSEGHPEWVEAVIRHTGKAYESYVAGGGPASFVDSGAGEHWWPSRGIVFGQLLGVLQSPLWAGHPELVQRFVEALPRVAFLNAYRTPIPVRELLARPEMAGHPEIVVAWARRAIPGESSWDWYIDQLLQEPHWRGDPTLRAICGGKDPSAACLRSPPPSGLSASDQALVDRLEALLRPGPPGQCP